MFTNWIELHPWMTFILGMMSILTINSFFVSIGGGYKKVSTLKQNPQINLEQDNQEHVNVEQDSLKQKNKDKKNLLLD